VLSPASFVPHQRKLGTPLRQVDQRDNLVVTTLQSLVDRNRTSPPLGVNHFLSLVVLYTMSEIHVTSSAAAGTAIEELINEIAFQKVLLSSIDDTVQNREAAENDVRTEIRTLEAQLRNLRRSTTNTASDSRPSASSQQPETASSISSPNKSTADGDASAGTTMNGYLSE